MRLVILVLAIVCLSGVDGGETPSAYVIVQASLQQRNMSQPTWVGLWRQTESPGGTYLHLPADGALTEVPPGDYRISHINFGPPDPDVSRLTLRKSSFEVTPGRIYFLGHIEIQRPSTHGMRLKYGSSLKLLEKICAEDPEVLEKYPLVTFDNPDNEIHRPCVALRQSETSK